MIQVEFANRTTEILKADKSVIGLAVAGSWLTNELDEFSDLDLILVTHDLVSGDRDKMLAYARRFGHLLSGFTGEHVGEPRVLICLYDNPLLHVDIKFLTLEEFKHRIEQPIILLDTDRQLQEVIDQTPSHYPFPGFQWIEDRFWVWIHYALSKIGRGEYFEAIDFLAFLRLVVIGPLVHLKNNNLPRGLRKIETQVATQDFEKVKETLTDYSRVSILESLEKAVVLYRHLRTEVFTKDTNLHVDTEISVMKYFDTIKQRNG